ncbi:hypothetical protein R1flu_019530 [Riccia fluitans]|uniref:Uncharacterized protein n=1 Tax=Riccia fluitans TaxID=41844 RepID=A0ABD1ZJ89_9MARC
MKPCSSMSLSSMCVLRLVRDVQIMSVKSVATAAKKLETPTRDVNHTGSSRRHRKVAELPGPLCLGYTPAGTQQKAVQIEDQDLLPRNLRLNRTGSRILH